MASHKLSTAIRRITVLWVAAIAFATMSISPAFSASQLPAYLEKVQPGELFEGADRFGDPSGQPPIAPVYRGEEMVGYAYLSSDFTASTGYSG